MSARPEIAPEVSVVMGVRDAGSELSRTVDSILGQQGVELELIVVDDGSTDGTPNLLAARAALDPRLRVLRQEPAGLTAALILGCAAARAPLVARQDAGDRSHPERLRLQRELFERLPALVLASSWTACFGPSAEPLFVERGRAPADRPHRMLEGDPLEVVSGPTSHGSVMFRADAYRKAGGYRLQFALGQDWDLWQRLGLLGDFLQVGATLYARSFHARSLSFAFHDLQVEFGRLSLAALRARSVGEPEELVLSLAEDLARRMDLERAARVRRGAAMGEYHVGELLRRVGDPRCRGYFRRALETRPTLLRAALRLMQSMVLRRPVGSEEPDLDWAFLDSDAAR